MKPLLSRLGLVAVLLAASAGIWLAPALWGQLSQAGKVKGFKWPVFYDPIPGKIPANRFKSLITGAEAQPLSRDVVAVKQMRLEYYHVDGRTNAVAIAPECLIDRTLGQVSSTGRLELATGDGQLSLEGNEGFLCQLTNFHLIVSNRVRTIINHNLLQPAKP